MIVRDLCSLSLSLYSPDALVPRISPHRSWLLCSSLITRAIRRRSTSSSERVISFLTRNPTSCARSARGSATVRAPNVTARSTTRSTRCFPSRADPRHAAPAIAGARDGCRALPREPSPPASPYSSRSPCHATRVDVARRYILPARRGHATAQAAALAPQPSCSTKQSGKRSQDHCSTRCCRCRRDRP